MAKKSSKNYLDFVPLKNTEYLWCEEDGMVTVTVPWKGFYNRLAQKLFHKPQSSDIAMDQYGSFVWKQIDGKRTVFEIAELVEHQFGEEANPIYERLIKFVEILKEHKFVTLKEKNTDASFYS